MALAELYKSGKITWESGMAKASKADELERLIGPAPVGTGKVGAH